MKKTRCPHCETDNRKGAECCHYCGHDIPPQNGASREETLRSSDGVAELDAALSQLCSAREILKRDEDSSDYHRISHQIERLRSMIARRIRSATESR